MTDPVVRATPLVTDHRASLPEVRFGRGDRAEQRVALHRCEQGAGTSLCKALSILDTLADGAEDAMGVSELARAIGVPKSTAHRLLKILEYHGFLMRNGTQYSLGLRFFELNRSVHRPLLGDLPRAAAPILEDLFEQVRETVHLAVPQGDEIVFLEKITAPGGSRIPSRVGQTMPTTCTALGKAVLAFSPPDLIASILRAELISLTPYSVRHPAMLLKQLKIIRATGVAYDAQESTVGIACVSAPIIGRGGLAIGAVSVAGPTTRFRPDRAARDVRSAANKIMLAVASLPVG